VVSHRSLVHPLLNDETSTLNCSSRYYFTSPSGDAISLEAWASLADPKGPVLALRHSPILRKLRRFTVLAADPLQKQATANNFAAFAFLTGSVFRDRDLGVFDRAYKQLQYKTTRADISSGNL